MINKKKHIKIAMAFLLVFSGIFYFYCSESFAWTKGDTYYKDGKTWASGYFYLYIKDDDLDSTSINPNCTVEDSKIKILVSRSTAPSYTTMVNQSTSWNFSIDKENSINNHNVKLTDTSISTGIDQDNAYTTFRIPLSYTMPKYHNHLTSDSSHTDKMRLNFRTGSKNDPTSGTYTPQDEKREGLPGPVYNYYTTSGTCNLVIQINAGNIGIKSFNGYKYTGSSITNTIFTPHKSVYRAIFAEGFPTTTNTLNPNSTEVTASKNRLILYANEKIFTTMDWNKDITFKNNFGSPDSPKGSNDKGAPNGFQMGNKAYYNGEYLEPPDNPILGDNGFKVNMAGEDKTFSLYYTPTKYDITYTDSIKDGKTKLPANTTYTICDAKKLSNPTRTDGRKFLGWQVTSGTIKDKIKSVKTILTGDTVTSISVLKENKLNANINGLTTYYDNAKLTSNNFYTYMSNRSTGNVTLKAIWSAPPVIKTPCKNGIAVSTKDNNEIDPYIMNYDANEDGTKEKCIIFQKNDTCTPKLYQKTTDAVDGDITNTDKVTGKTSGIRNSSDISKPIVLDKCGELKVDYTAINSNGNKSTNDNTIYANDPPQAESTDIIIFRGDDETLNQLLFTENVQIKDVEDAPTGFSKNSIKTKCEITSIENSNGESLPNDAISIDTDNPGIYKVSYKVTDSMKGEVKDSFTVEIVNPEGELNQSHIRFISRKYINTLSDNSIWTKNNAYKSLLLKSLNLRKGEGSIVNLEI